MQAGTAHLGDAGRQLLTGRAAKQLLRALCAAVLQTLKDVGVQYCCRGPFLNALLSSWLLQLQNGPGPSMTAHCTASSFLQDRARGVRKIEAST